jgi:N-acetylmuramoyl-L-alanine amidase
MRLDHGALGWRGLEGALVFIVAVMVGCTAQPKIDSRYHAVSQDSRVQFIVLHYTEVDFARSLNRLTKEEVSSHYLINDQPPTVYRLVEENQRAWHAGPSAVMACGRIAYSGTAIFSL